MYWIGTSLSEKPYGIVYVLTSPSGKQYVGQTVKTIRHRLRKHRSLAEGYFQNSAIASAIRKYGIENFESEIVVEAYDQEELDLMEIKYIKSMKTMSPIGYNLVPGGRSRKHSEETRHKLRIAATGRSPSKETRRKMSESNKWEKNGFYGKNHTEETKKKMRSYVRTDEHKRKLGEAHKGVALTQEHKDKIRSSLRFHHDTKEKQPILHGTYSGYKRGCRERCCLDANSEYHKAWRLRTKDR